MTMGERIRSLRKQHNMTQDELGKRLGVGRSAILKYENGQIENLPRSTIEKMASLFNVRPCYIMCFDEEESEGYLSDETIEKLLIDKYGKEFFQLVNVYMTLNTKNKSKLLSYCKDLLKAESFESMISDSRKIDHIFSAPKVLCERGTGDE